MLTIETEEKLDPRVKRTRQMLEQAFMDVVREKGLQSVSVQDIAERAGVNRATFYAHFEDKYALLAHSIRLGFRQELEKRTLSACHFSVDNLRALIITVCEFTSNISGHCNPPQGQFESLIETQVKAQIHDLLTAWLKNTKSEIASETAATAASWALYGLAQQWSHNKNHAPVEVFAEEVLPIVAANLSIELA